MIKTILKNILFYIVGLTLLLISFLFWYSYNDRAIDYDVSTDGLVIPEFDQQFLPFEPTYDPKQTLPFAAAAVIDIDNDGVDELFFGGGIHQQDAFYQYQNNGFVDITLRTNWQKKTPDKTFGALVLDLDMDGDNDMLVTRQSGVWLYTNSQGSFDGEKLNLDLDPQTVPLSVAVADLNRDGFFDMYVSGYIARKHVQGETIFNMEYGGVSALFMNRGNGQFQNITQESGLLYQHNTFQAVFIDVDNDNREDLVVAHDTGQVRTWKNMGNLKFESISNPTSNYFSYPMGIGVSDYNNDSLPDFFFSNVGSTTPDALVRGDLRADQILNKKWIMFENRGDFQFEDVARKTKLADYEFSWGAIFEDFNLDGKDDLVVSENYIGFPTHKIAAFRLDGRFLLQNPQGEFAEVSDQTKIKNRYFGLTPLTSDFNQDGYPDLVHVNLMGPQQVFLSKAGDQQYLKIQLPNTVESIAAKVAVTLDDGSTIHQTFVVGEGLCSDQSHVLIFGLGKASATRVQVRFIDGEMELRDGDFVNETLVF